MCEKHADEDLQKEFGGTLHTVLQMRWNYPLRWMEKNDLGNMSTEQQGIPLGYYLQYLFNYEYVDPPLPVLANSTIRLRCYRNQMASG